MLIARKVSDARRSGKALGMEVPVDVEGRAEVPKGRVFTLNCQILNLSCVSRILTAKVPAPCLEELNSPRERTSRSLSMGVSTNKRLVCLLVTLQ